MSANTGIITHSGVANEITQYYDSIIGISPSTGHNSISQYCFLARVDTWDNINTIQNEELTPPGIELSQKNIKNIYNNMFIMKRLYPSDFSPLVDRIDWVSGHIYDVYRDDIDILIRDTSGRMVNKFYVKNKFDQVFKCLGNNKGAAATVEPYFEPGVLSSTLVYIGADGYKWIYMYSIQATLKQKFMTEEWMPTPFAKATVNFKNTMDSGNIPVINVLNGGSNYYTSNTFVTVTGANTTQTLAHAIISGGVITDILVTNIGANYTSAEITITSPTGIGAIASANVSPVDGHGSDPFDEFGANHMMITQTFAQDENLLLPTDINYRQVGFIVNPIAKSSYPIQCEKPIYSLSTDVVVSNGFGTFVSDEIVFQGVDVDSATFIATCLSFSSGSNLIKMINTTGTLRIGQSLIGNQSKTTRVVLNVNDTDFIPYSGQITYIENREGTQRSNDGSEQVRLIIGF